MATCVFIQVLGERRRGCLIPAAGLDCGPTPFTWTFRGTSLVPGEAPSFWRKTASHSSPPAFSTEPDAAVHVRVRHDPRAGTKAATSAALFQPAVTCRFWIHRLLGKMVRLGRIRLIGLDKFNPGAGALRAQRGEQRCMRDEREGLGSASHPGSRFAYSLRCGRRLPVRGVSPARREPSAARRWRRLRTCAAASSRQQDRRVGSAPAALSALNFKFGAPIKFM